MYSCDSLREILAPCDDKLDRSIPVWNEADCVWETTTIAGIGAVDCVAIEACMAPTVTGINNAITAVQNGVSNMGVRVSALEALSHHDHANLSVLDGIRNDLAANRYLAGDGSYQTIPVSYFYQNVQSNTNPVVQRPTINFSPVFAVTDDPVNQVTTVSIDPAFL